MKYGAEQVTALIKPVSVCMVMVIATIKSVAYFATQNTQFVYVLVRLPGDTCVSCATLLP